MENIEYIVWDVDKTLYKNNPKLNKSFLKDVCKKLQERFNLNSKEANKLISKKLKESDTLFQVLVGLGLKDSINELMDNAKYEPYLRKDEKLIKMFDSLKDYKHAIISNGTRKSCCNVLRILGLSLDIFEMIITTEDVKNPKPNEEPFLKLLEKTGLPPEKHVYIGDLDKLDIPAPKKLGMKTILVWGKSEIADISLPTVYDVLNVLKKYK